MLFCLLLWGTIYSRLKSQTGCSQYRKYSLYKISSFSSEFSRLSLSFIFKYFPTPMPHWVICVPPEVLLCVASCFQFAPGELHRDQFNQSCFLPQSICFPLFLFYLFFNLSEVNVLFCFWKQMPQQFNLVHGCIIVFVFCFVPD